MNPDPKKPKRKALVTVEFQNEVDLATGTREKRMFVKMYFEARDSGLLAAIPDEEWRTLCALATYMDEEGRCYPSQDEIARVLGIGRQAANRRIQKLREFRFQGQPIISLEKTRTHSAKGPTRWSNNVYRLHPIASFDFGGGDRLQQELAGDPEEFSVSPRHDIENSPGSVSLSMSQVADTAEGDTNKNIRNTKNVTNVGQKTTEENNTAVPKRPRLTKDQFVTSQGLALTVAETIGQQENFRSYFKIAADCVRINAIQLLFDALGETKERIRDGTIRTTASQYFHAAVKRRLAEHARTSQTAAHSVDTQGSQDDDPRKIRAAIKESVDQAKGRLMDQTKVSRV